MNHCYRLVWNQDTQRYVPAPECAKGKSKNTSKSNSHKALVPAAIILSTTLVLSAWAQSPPANTLPTGGKVTAGQATISQSGNQMAVNQGTNKAIIDWSSFNIGSNAGVTFQQPNASAIALNRVSAGDASQIHGQLNANGQVWLVNPNGIVFGKGSKVDVGGLVASTMNIANDDFLNGKHTFNRNGATGSITNHGEISAKDGGYVALLAPTVSNDGIIRAQLGSVVMAAGEQITLQAGANGLLNVQVDPSTVRTLIENKQLVVADGGQVVMTGKAADALSASVVANTGTIQANRLQEKNGQILLIADMQYGETKAAGRLEAKFIDTSAATVSIDKNLKINTHGGEWLIDPVDIVIDQNKATAIESALNTGNVTVSTADSATNAWGSNGAGSDAGDIHINADISYTQNKLTLNADNDIHLNAAINVNGAGTLALNYGTSGSVNASFAEGGGFKGQVNFAGSGMGLMTMNGDTYQVIKDVGALQAMSNNLAGKYVLGGNIDANGLNNFIPIGDKTGQFTGTFDGFGHTINNLTIRRTNNNQDNTTGLFGNTNGATLRNVGLAGGSVETVSGSRVGALVGDSLNTRISHTYATASVASHDSTWGWFVGGLVGVSQGSHISHSYATGKVAGNWFVGGLVGSSDNHSIINQSYAAGQVAGRSGSIGGLVGRSVGSSQITNSYATGHVEGYDQVGGLVGTLSTDAQIANSYATGRVATIPSSTGTNVGGLAGSVDGGGVNNNITNAFYATTDANGISNGNAAGIGGTGKTWVDLADANTYSTWDLGIWSIASGRGSAIAGYEVGRLPSLMGITRTQDAQNIVLFDGGMGTSGDAYGISNWQHLANMGNSNAILRGNYHFALKSNLDSSSNGYATLASATANGGAGWSPIGNDSAQFSGTFDGQNHTLSDLHIDRSGQDDVGLFGVTHNATLLNVGLLGGSVRGQDNVGALVGRHWTNGGATTRIDSVYATTDVTGRNNVGGLAGQVHADFPQATATVSNVYATGDVAGDSNVGGLVGRLAGSSYAWAYIRNAYATGSVTASGGNVGGLLGLGEWEVKVDGFYASTDASGAAINQGGSAWGTAKTLAALQQLSTFTDAGWDMDDAGGTDKIWRIYDGHSGPLLRSFLRQLTVTADSANLIGVSGKTYDGQQAGGQVAWHTADPALGGSLRWASASKDAGAYDTANGGLRLGGLHSGQQGYDISYTLTGENISLTIDRKALSVTGTTVAGRTYNGSADVLAQTSAGNANGLINTDDVTLRLGSAILDSRNAGNRNATVTYALTGRDATNYIVGNSTHSVVVSKANLSISAVADHKTYDGSAASASMVQATGLAAGDVLTGLGQSFDSRNAGDRTLSVNGDYLLDDGNGGGNYTVTTHSASGSIDRANITIGADAVRRTYDGTTAANGTAKVTGGELFAGDSLSGGSFAFTNKNAGQNKTVTVSDVAVNDGNNGGNYNVTYVDNTTSTIDRAALNITAHSSTKPLSTPLVLNGSTGFSSSGQVQGETVSSVTLKSAGSPTDAMVGSYAITASGAVGSHGFDASNYDIQYVDGNLTVISPMDGGVIWREAQALPLHAQPSRNSVPTTSGAVAHLTLAPGFIQLQEDQ